MLLDEYNRDFNVVWTAHKWDINGMNISKEIPNNVDPYAWPWCSSHLRTFKSSLIRKHIMIKILKIVMAIGLKEDMIRL